VNVPSWINRKTIPILILVGLIVLAVIVYYQIPTPITPQLTMFRDALFSLNFDKITTAFWALIGGVGGLTGLTAGLAYAYTQMKKQATSITTSFNQYKTQASQTFDQLTGQNTVLSTAKTDLDGKLQAVQTEKDALASTAKDYESKLSAAQLELNKQKIIIESKTQQVAANFRAAIPSDTTFIDPITGNKLVKVVETVVK
jgi:hypothetical protein